MIDIFKDNKLVHIPTLQDYIIIVSYAIRNSINWANGSNNILEEQWYDFKSETCVNISTYGLFYGNRSQYIRDGYVVLDIDYYYDTIPFYKIIKEFI